MNKQVPLLDILDVQKELPNVRVYIGKRLEKLLREASRCHPSSRKSFFSTESGTNGGTQRVE
jgi:hypothetical protein